MVTNGKHNCLLFGRDLSHTEMWYECWRFQLFTVDFSQSFKVTSHNQSFNLVDCVVSCCALLLLCFCRLTVEQCLKVVTWLILPVVICLSQRLSHACLSISNLYSETANGSLNQLSFI